MPRISVLPALALLAAVTILVAGGQAPAPVLAQSAQLPALPARWPSTLQLGMGDGPGGAATMRRTAPFGFRYQYLAGGAGTGWTTWNSPAGAFADLYIQDSINNGIVPVFTYYQLRQTAPNSSNSDDGVADYNNLQDRNAMTAYYNDLKVLFQRAGAYPNNMIVVHVEPDLWGFMQQRSSGDNAATVPAQVSATGMPELSGLPNNVAGLAQAVVKLRDTYARNVVLGYHLSIWGTGNDILYTDPDNTTVSNLATRSANFYQSLQAPFDITFAEYSDRDAAFKQYVYGDGGASWWSAGDYTRNELFISRFVSLTQKRVVFWQIPVGNTRMQAENNTWEHYQDNHVEWLLDDPSRANVNAYVQAGVVAFLFGRGADGPTCFCDAAGDGVTNPAPINGNTRASLNADDDGGFFRDRSANYYGVGAIGLPSGGSTPPTNTPVPTPSSTPTIGATATPTRTPAPATSTPVPTNTPTSGGSTQTITFDNLTSPNRPLTGQYPSGLIDWGSGAWYLSGPYGRFNTQSISFNGGGPTSANFNFVSPQRLVQVDAYNGGSVTSTVSLSCAGQTTRSVSVPAGQVATVATSWSGTCTTVSVGSSNGWDTNFDNFVVSASGAAATATATPTASATPTRTPVATSTPTASATGQTLTFDDLSNPNRPLNGQYPSGVADWGTNVWYLSSPWGQFRTQSISFNGASLTSANVTFVTPKRMVRIDAYNGGSTPSTVTLTCNGQPSVSTTVGANALVTVNTGWTAACSSVAISSSNGWNTNFDNILIQ